MGEREPKCTCCDDRRFVLTATGETRPCSRCNDVEFSRWSDARRPRVGTAIACAASSKGGETDGA